ncbi:hypothetical protein D7X33_10015 [Butyricicoccus sp. 1XD8-22]|nr:hypothetical protein D7X33_10015 [Butyricicoccus sp. 1XD8-22]
MLRRAPPQSIKDSHGKPRALRRLAKKDRAVRRPSGFETSSRLTREKNAQDAKKFGKKYRFFENNLVE